MRRAAASPLAAAGQKRLMAGCLGPIDALMKTRTARRLAGMSAPATTVASVGAVLVIAAIDLASGTELSLSLFYLGPVAVMAWRIGIFGAIPTALGGAAAWYGVDLAGGHVYAHPLIPLWNTLVRLGFFVIVSVLLVRLHQSMERESALAHTDPLTGLLNRRAFEEQAAREIERAGRTGAPVSFAYLDIDDFKDVNDRLGHAAGDDVLRTVAGVLGLVLRAVDLKARLGGDEFALVLPDTGADSAAPVIERLEAGLSAAGVSCSIGTVVFRSPPGSVDEALATVDGLMYEVKADPGRRSAIRLHATVRAPSADAS